MVMYIRVSKGSICLLPLSQQYTPAFSVSLCISSFLKGAAKNKNGMALKLTHSEEHRPQVEEVLTYLLTDLTVEERRRIGRGQSTLESGLVCPCIETLPSSELDCEMASLLYSIDMLLHAICGINISEFLSLVVCSAHSMLCCAPLIPPVPHTPLQVAHVLVPLLSPLTQVDAMPAKVSRFVLLIHFLSGHLHCFTKAASSNRLNNCRSKYVSFVLDVQS